jgi:hypothetical protein
VYPHRALMAPRVRATIEYLLAEFARDETLHVGLEQLTQPAVTRARRRR